MHPICACADCGEVTKFGDDDPPLCEDCVEAACKPPLSCFAPREPEVVKRLRRATELLREWRDKHGGREHFAFRSYHSPDVIATASQTDLLRETQRFLEGK